MGIASLAAKRLATSLPTLLLILIGVFLLLQLAPGDTVDALLAQMGGGGDAKVAADLRKSYGLDLSVATQLGQYLFRLVRFDLGFQLSWRKSASSFWMIVCVPDSSTVSPPMPACWR